MNCELNVHILTVLFTIQALTELLQSLVPGGHLSMLDGKQSENLPSWLFKIVLKLGRPFGYTPEYFHVRPWESVERYFKETSFETRYGGMIYILSGTARWKWSNNRINSEPNRCAFSFSLSAALGIK